MHSEKKVKYLFSILCFSVTLIFIDAIFQLLTGSDFIRGNSGERLSASFKNPNGFAGWLIVVIPILFVITSSGFLNLKYYFRRIFNSFITILILIGIFLLVETVSKGAIIGFIFSVLLMIYLSFLFKINGLKKKLIVYGCLILIIIFAGNTLPLGSNSKENLIERIGLFKRTVNEKTEIRIILWKECINIIKDYPLFGAGPNTYNFMAKKYKLKEYTGIYPHNSYLQLTAEIGFIGLFAFLYILYWFFSNAISTLKKHKDSFLLGLLGGISGFLVHSFFDVNLFSVQLISLFWVILALGVARIYQLNEANLKILDIS